MGVKSGIILFVCGLLIQLSGSHHMPQETEDSPMAKHDLAGASLNVTSSKMNETMANNVTVRAVSMDNSTNLGNQTAMNTTGLGREEEVKKPEPEGFLTKVKHGIESIACTVGIGGCHAAEGEKAADLKKEDARDVEKEKMGNSTALSSNSTTRS